MKNIVRVEQEGGIAVFNFTVEGHHNYFILAKEYDYGQSCVLVHNAKCGVVDTDDQRALRELINETTQKGRKPLTPDDANTLLDWADEVGLPYKASATDPD